MPFRLVNEISDQSKALSLEFANSDRIDPQTVQIRPFRNAPFALRVVDQDW